MRAKGHLSIAVLLMTACLPAAPAARVEEPCGAITTRSLTEAERRVQQGDDDGAIEALMGDDVEAGCPERELARLSLEGWREARRLALSGGDPGRLGPVREWLARLSAVDVAGDAELARARDLADALIRAAVAAAQDERDEMSLYLTHARGLAAALRLAQGEARWPLPVDLAAGELWLEVDRYAEAREAFDRAADGPRTALGRARVIERTAGRDDACGAYRRAERLLPSGAARRRVAEALGRLGCGAL